MTITDEDVAMHDVVRDLHTANPYIYWADLIGSAIVGWGAFALAVMASPLSLGMWLATVVSALALYRGLCFIHELTHLKYRAVPGFETAWNVLIGFPLLLPSFTYIGVHWDHHNTNLYGTADDPEYLPFAHSRPLIWTFAFHAALIFPLAVIWRFVVIAPVALLVPPLHRWLEVHASSFAVNHNYERHLAWGVSKQMKYRELIILACCGLLFWAISHRLVPVHIVPIWYLMAIMVCFLNMLRVLGAHDYESTGTPMDRHGQLADSIDTPGGPWTELWAPVGLRYHALHHFFPGIPYHNLGTAYSWLKMTLPEDAAYYESTSPSLRHSLLVLYTKAGRG